MRLMQYWGCSHTIRADVLGVGIQFLNYDGR
jgi:hypothetical protein